MRDLFPPVAGPRVLATPLGVDFCAALVAGLDAMLQGQSPEAIARVDLYVANARMERRLRALYIARGAGFLPRIRPVQALGDSVDLSDLPPAIPPLRLRLELVQLIGKLLDAQPKLAPRSALYDLADSLADLMGEMFEEGVTPQAIAGLDVGDHAIHWQRAQAFLDLVTHFLQDDAALTREARQTRIVARLARLWQSQPPAHPVIVAGSTGSRGATAQLMEAVARLPQGAVILPGIDRDMPQAIWARLLEDRREGLDGEDHPQYRLARFADRLGLDPWAIPDWPGAERPRGGRGAVVSLALRPAPVTDQWMTEGPRLTGLAEAMAGVTLLEAPNPQVEATAIALRLRQAVAEGKRAAVIASDRTLTRQVTAALSRWGITPDDSAGQPLSLSPPGRFLRHVAEIEAKPADPEALAVILKHPLCHTGSERGLHLLRARDLEVQVLRARPGLPSRARLVEWADKRRDDPGAMAWVGWLTDHLLSPIDPGALPMDTRVARHLVRAEALAAGPDAAGSGDLFDKEPGEAARKLMDDLIAEASVGGAISASDYRDLFTALTQDREVRQPLFPHADILIWGTQEARVQGADLIILAGLNEGAWPAPPPADPWLNRALRAQAGLRLPDRVIGLAAHDFQQGMAAPEVWLTRARRDAETDTVPSRWLNRLGNLLAGSGPEAKQALAGMTARGEFYIALATRQLTPQDTTPFEPRPAPQPPAVARPRRLSVTEVETLIRDPYAVYARRVLGLRKLDPLRAEADARVRGSVLHKVMQDFIEATMTGLPDRDAALAQLLGITDSVLEDEAPWPAARRLWRARMGRVAGFILDTEVERRARGLPEIIERLGEWEVPGTGVTLRGKGDRIDRLHDGRLAIYDYKTGAPPTEKEERHFAKQLWLMALMAEGGAFGLPQGASVGHVAYVGLGAKPVIRAHDIDPAELAIVTGEFIRRLHHMGDPASGFPSRRAIKDTRYAGDYDQLARYGEWDETQTPLLIPVGRDDGGPQDG
ncbi:double-strand break repair protein AddB [Roseicyclus mahoneyensis]|uniref:Double-strand break repair protein AddB n=1 Tax=Roseicyclus mahoneyensis TaxID=164332 RepID=A0A316GK05_9RHOB|nr:double-strand break repair protein AddB [Roseicyclus mahoneyensis]PWK61395.1 double-strand break repair protein AddB [Roseicyclus mahoneyensis]